MPTPRQRHGRATEPPTDRETLTTLCLTLNDQVIAQQFGVTGDTIRWWRRKWGISNARPSPKDYVIDDTFFSVIDTEEKAYILGFIAADGCIQPYGLVINLHPRDRDILERIRVCLQSTAPIRPVPKSQWPQITWQTGSKQLVADLRHHGIVPRKSLILTYPAMPAHLEPHYIRGLWDGDGHISRHDLVLKGSLATTTGAQQAIQRMTGCLLRLSPQENIFVLRGSGRDAPAIRWLYENNTIALQRKQAAYEAFWKEGTVIRHSLKTPSQYQLNLL